MRTVVGIDLGTQSLKVVFYDPDTRRIASSVSAPIELHRDQGGVAEQQADWWTRALADAMAAADPGIRKSVVAMGVSGQQHGFVAVDRSGEVLAPVKLWCDTSTEAECTEITAAFGGREACLDKLGNLVLPGYTASKILRLKKKQPELYERLDSILLPHDYLNFYLTGERCAESGDASGTGFLDIRKRTWSPDMLRAIDPGRDLLECLPPLRIENEAIGTLRPEIAVRLGLPPGVPVSIGGGDNMMGAIGTGNVHAGQVTMSLGTSGTVYAYSDHPVIDRKGSIAAFCSSTGGWLPLLCTMNCTVATELMRALLGAAMGSFEAQIQSAPAGAEGVITVPFFGGERTPNLPNARGCIVGLQACNARPENLLRSAVEGATFALRFGLERLRELGVGASEIVLTGGGAKSGQWRQVVADVCDVPVTVFQQDEGAAFGAAMQALELAEGRASLSRLLPDHLTRDQDRCCDPVPDRVRLYNEIFGEYQRAVAAATNLYG
ncbi:MAG: xylulokinase [Proteobacteria bacterium]|nr:xylulokinase [Pseudomonadota bacterium]